MKKTMKISLILTLLTLALNMVLKVTHVNMGYWGEFMRLFGFTALVVSAFLIVSHLAIKLFKS